MSGSGNRVLPIDEVLPELLDALCRGTSAVLRAAPGAGKTTRVPLALLDVPWLQGKRIVMLEPRRLAARSAARYMSEQTGQRLGQLVGYRMRQDTRVCEQTRIEVVTEGVLTRLLQEDPELSRYGLVIFDEFHERNLQADLGLALVLEARDAFRNDLRVLVMSATMDAAPVAELLGGAPLITSQGRSYPVDIRYAPCGSALHLETHVASVIARALREEGGSTLVFLPGQAEIRRVQQLLSAQLPDAVQVFPLYGNLSQAEQDAAVLPSPPGFAKVVLATNIAETSLTIEGIRVVVDAGLERRARFDPVSGMSRLVTGRISQASATQRAGRAGRLEPGVCYRLWARSDHNRLAIQATPEIMEADLAPLVLELAQWGATKPEQLAWLDLPPVPAWNQATTLLRALEALQADGTMTAHGRLMQEIGVHPRLAHMVLKGAALGWRQMACELAVLLSEKDVLRGHDKRQTDLMPRLRVLRDGADRWLKPLRSGVRALEKQVAALALPAASSMTASHEAADAGVLLGFAYPDRIARRREGELPRYLLANGRGAWLDQSDDLRQAPFLVAVELDGEAREARIYRAVSLSLGALEQYFSNAISQQQIVQWDEGAQAVSARRQRRLGALVLEDSPAAAPEPGVLLAGLLAAIRRKGLDVLPWDEPTRQWVARVRLMRSMEPELWPEVGDEDLLAQLEAWAAPFLAGVTRFSQLRRFPLQDALTAWLGYHRQARLDLQAPVRWQVPTGSRVLIDYTVGEVPVLAVKLQELFGEGRTPSIADGRVALMLYLLSPARRPVQVTRDLAGFWAGSYVAVRKDLRGRYPRHSWPDDPANAVPTRHAKNK